MLHEPEVLKGVRLHGRERHLVLGSYYLLKEQLSVTAGVLVKGIRIMTFRSWV